MSQLPDRPDRRRSTTSRCTPAPRWSAAHGDEHLERLTLRDTATGRDARRSTRPGCSSSSARQPRTDWLDGVRRPRRARLRPHRPRPHRGRQPPAGWPLPRDPYHLESSVPGVFAAGDVRAESVKRVASAVGEGAMAVIAGAPIPGGAVSDRADRPSCDPATSCATLFLFEALDRRAARLAGRARPGRAARRRRLVYAEGEPATCFFVLLAGTVVAEPAGRAATTSRSPAPTSAASTAAPPRRTSATRSPQVYRNSLRAITDVEFFVLPADEFGDADARRGSRWRCTCWRGCSSGMRNSQTDRRRAGAAARPRLAVGRADPRAEQPGRGGGAGHRRRCATGSPGCGTSWR